MDSITHNLIYQTIEKELLENAVSSFSPHAVIYLGQPHAGPDETLVIGYDEVAPYHPQANFTDPDIVEWQKRLLVKAITEKYDLSLKCGATDDFSQILALLWNNGYDTEIVIFAQSQLKTRLYAIETGVDLSLPSAFLSQIEAEGNFSRLVVYTDMMEEIFSSSAEHPRKGVVKAVQSAEIAPWKFSEVCKFRDKCTELKLKFTQTDSAKVSEVDELFAASFDLGITDKNAFSGKHADEFLLKDIYAAMQEKLLAGLAPVKNPEFVLIIGQPGCDKFGYAKANYPDNYVFISNGICRSFIPKCVDIYNQGADILAATDHKADQLCLDILSYATAEKYNIVCMTSLGHELLTGLAKTILNGRHKLTINVMAVNDCQSRVNAYLRFHDDVERLGYGVLIPSDFMNQSYDQVLNTVSIFEAENLFDTLSVISGEGKEIYRSVPGDKRRAVNAVMAHREKIWSEAETKRFNELCSTALEKFKGSRDVTKEILDVRERSTKYAYRPSIKFRK